MSMGDLIASVKSSSFAMYPIAVMVGIQSGFYTYQLTRIPFVIAQIGITSQRKKDALITLSVFSLSLVIMINLLGSLLSAVPRFNFTMSLWTGTIFLTLGIMCLIPGIIISGVFKLDEKTILPHFTKYKRLIPLSAFATGVLFSLLETPICPSCGSNISIIASNTIGKGNISEGVLLLSLYAMGECIPIGLTCSVFIILWKDLFSPDTRAREAIMLLDGLLLILSATLFFWTS